MIKDYRLTRCTADMVWERYEQKKSIHRYAQFNFYTIDRTNSVKDTIEERKKELKDYIVNGSKPLLGYSIDDEMLDINYQDWTEDKCAAVYKTQTEQGERVTQKALDSIKACRVSVIMFTITLCLPHNVVLCRDFLEKLITCGLMLIWDLETVKIEVTEG